MLPVALANFNAFSFAATIPTTWRVDQNSNSSFLICGLHALIQGRIVTQPERARKAGESRSD
jgi:hypothetical protein